MMGILDHLEELRRRIIVSLLAVVIFTAIAWFLSEPILRLLLAPMGGLRLTAFSLMDGFMVRFQIALYIGIAAAFPVWGYELYMFIAPGLLEGERRALLPGLLASTGLFVVGVLFGFYLLPIMISAMISFFPAEMNFMPAASDYIAFVIFFLVAVGVSFQLPVVITILVQLRILNVSLLQKQRRIAYFLLFAFAEIVTPVSDPFFAPLTIMIPLVVLYEGSILAAIRIESGRKKAARLAPGSAG
jgi:sec-independent protein translocase protein TatC